MNFSSRAARKFTPERSEPKEIPLISYFNRIDLGIVDVEENGFTRNTPTHFEAALEINPASLHANAWIAIIIDGNPKFSHVRKEEGRQILRDIRSAEPQNADDYVALALIAQRLDKNPAQAAAYGQLAMQLDAQLACKYLERYRIDTGHVVSATSRGHWQDQAAKLPPSGRGFNV